MTAARLTSKIKQEDRRTKLALYVLYCLLIGVPFCFLKTPCSLDGSATIANTAALYGLDWSAYMKELGSYFFKYGYALISYPVFWIQNPFLRYTIQILVHAAILGCIPVLAYSVATQHLGMQQGWRTALCALATGLIPAVAMEGMIVHNDVLLVVLPWICVFSVLEANQAVSIKRRVLYSVVAAASACYSNMCHTRGVVLPIALLITVVVIRIYNRRWPIHVWSFFATMGILLALDQFILTPYFKSTVWSMGIDNNTLDTFDFKVFRQLLTVEGMKQFFRMGIGWMVSFGAGTLLFGLVGMWDSTWSSLKIVCGRSSENDASKIAHLLVTLLFWGSYLLGMLFFFSKIMYTSPGVRGDRYVFSRYLAVAYGPMMLLGLRGLIGRKSHKRVIIGTLVGSTVLAVIYQLALNPDLRGLLNNQAALLFQWVSDQMKPYSLFGGLKGAALLYFTVAVICFGLTVLMGWKREKMAGLVLCLCLYGCLASAYFSIRLPIEHAYASVTHDVTEAVYAVQHNSDESITLYIDESARVVAANGVATYPLRTYQPLLPRINVKGDKTIGAEEDYLIVCSQETYTEHASKPDTWLIEGFDYDTPERDVLLVHGKVMEHQLWEQGYSLYAYACDAATASGQSKGENGR